MPPRFIARHLSQPSGVLGRIVGRLMNRNNAKMNAFAVKLLELTPDDRVLEVGYPADIFRSRSPEEVVAALNEAGFRRVLVERPKPTTRSIVVIANR
jgi:hypothetical protein